MCSTIRRSHHPRRSGPMKGVQVLASVFVSVNAIALLLLVSAAQAGDKECVDIELDTCPPAACTDCAPLFWSCPDQDCVFLNQECQTGEQKCSITKKSAVIGQ